MISSDTPSFIVRVAGLSADTVAELESSPCIAQLGDFYNLNRELIKLRADLSEHIYTAIPDAFPSTRRGLLAIRRDCFNGRSLARHLETDWWPEIHQTVRDLASRILLLEEHLAGWRENFDRLFAQEQQRQRSALLSLLTRPQLRRGIALASTEILRSMERLSRADNPAVRRKEQKLDESLLRYVSRAAYKLSPFSTLTRVALGQLEEGSALASPTLVGASWQEASLTRLKRYRLNQITALIFRHEGFRLQLSVQLNDTVEELTADQYQFLRPGWYGFDLENKRFRHFGESLIKVHLRGPMITWLRANLPGQSPNFAELIALLQQEFEVSRERVEQILAKLLDIGFLYLLPPWSSNEPHIEKSLLMALVPFEGDPILGQLFRVIKGLIAATSSFPTTDDPVTTIEQIDQGVAGAWDIVRPLAGLGREVQADGAKVGNFNEDILLSPETPGALLRLPATTATRLHQSTISIVRFSFLFDTRHDFRYSLSALLRERWPERFEIPLLEAFNILQPLIREYTDFASLHQRVGQESCFNPFRLETLDRLQTFRQEIWREAAGCVHSSEGQTHISRQALEALVQQIPEYYAPATGPCLFVQPADAKGKLWVLNRMLDGTGRYGSRYTAAMAEETRSRYTAHLRARATVDHDGETMELLDLMWSQADNLNVHAVQTPRVLEFPGERVFDLDNRTRVCLGDLRVRFSSEGLPYLVETDGRRLLPVYLGTMTLRLMPPILKFLALLGPSDFTLITPPRAARTIDGVEIQDRLLLDELVLMRKRWIVPTNDLARQIHSTSDAEAFLRLNDWRLRTGLPDRVFVAEKMPLEFLRADVRKPQYLDFTSPLFVTVARSVLNTTDLNLTFEEMLPLPEAFPQDEEGLRWAIELQLDTLALRAPVTYPKPLAPASIREPASDAPRHEAWNTPTSL